jgi:hypothetical protein
MRRRRARCNGREAICDASQFRFVSMERIARSDWSVVLIILNPFITFYWTKSKFQIKSSEWVSSSRITPSEDQSRTHAMHGFHRFRKLKLVSYSPTPCPECHSSNPKSKGMNQNGDREVPDHALNIIYSPPKLNGDESNRVSCNRKPKPKPRRA